MDNKLKEFMNDLDRALGTRSTDEQREFASDFREPMYSFSNPGTGKSFSIINGLVTAQTYHGIRGSKINAMSFTRDATAELKVRYDRVCKKLRIAPTVKFNTFHSICLKIIKRRYPTMKTIATYNVEAIVGLMSKFIEKRGYEITDEYQIKDIVLAIESLNRTLCFDKTNVALNYEFRKLDIDLDLFQGLREDLLISKLVSKEITRGDQPIYALYVLANNPDILAEFRNQYDIMVVDEFQDMTKLYLTVLSMISKNLVVIGDMKQQIYGFNGACADIVEEYLKLYPNAKRVDLTQSFRCRNEIADYATRIIRPNDKTIVPFKGTTDGGRINIVQNKDLNVKSIISSIKKEREKKDIYSVRDTMFLCRNNASLIPIIEECFQQDVMFRVSKRIVKIMDLPIFKDIIPLALIAEDPCDIRRLEPLVKLIPEFRSKGLDNCILIESLRMLKAKKAKSGDMSPTSILDLKLRIDNPMYTELIPILSRANVLIHNDKTADHVLSVLLPYYEKYIIKGKWWMLDNSIDYYLNLTAGITTKKTFRRMIEEEYAKELRALECTERGIGVKCYTVHSAKGLEANDVYVVDVNEGVFPGDKFLDKVIRADCLYEAAKIVREERNLLYVAVTRAKENVYICYSDTLSALVSSPQENQYTYLDETYASTKRVFNDVEAFKRMLNIKTPQEKVTSGTTYTNEDVVEEFSLIGIEDI